MSMIWVIDDDEAMQDCVELAIKKAGDFKVKRFTNAISPMQDLEVLPKLIFLDILLDGPNGLTLLNELVSYEDTAKIPIVIISSLTLEKIKLTDYNVVRIFNKATMTPQEIIAIVRQYA